jgi:hypothetical protein
MGRDPENAEPLRLVHHHPGYLRAQANVFMGQEEEDSPVESARKTAEDTPGFRKWSHSPKTGSIVVEYEPGDFDPDRLLTRVAKKAGLSGVVIDVRSTVHRRELVHGFIDGVQEVNRIVAHATADRADLRELIPFALAGVSVVSFVLGDKRGSRLPRWDSALYRSYRIFMQWHRKEVRDREKAARKIEEKILEARHALGDG